MNRKGLKRRNCDGGFNQLLILVIGLLCPFFSWSNFYPTSYQQSQRQFLQLAESFSAIPGVENYHLRVPTKTTAELFIDGLYLPQQSDDKERLVIVTSGIHGVEAFTGAAIQMQFLKENFQPEWLQKTGFLIIHAVNPYGFHFLRRVDEDNVDLNRNVSGNNDLFARVSKPYSQFEPYLNPKRPVKTGFFADARLFIQSLIKLITHGKKKITQIAVGGQYQNPKGIYYGGSQVQPNSMLLQFMFNKAGSRYQKILHIDLHTGYGERGRLHFFSSRQAMKLPGFSEVFAGYSIDAGSDKDFYKTSGGFGPLTMMVFNQKDIVIPMTFEFGTLDSQTIMGGFYSLRNMIYENQGFHFGYASPTDEKMAKKNFLNMFNPEDPKWRDQVLKSGTQTLETVVTRFSKI